MAFSAFTAPAAALALLSRFSSHSVNFRSKAAALELLEAGFSFHSIKFSSSSIVRRSFHTLDLCLKGSSIRRVVSAFIVLILDPAAALVELLAADF